ncbi:MAG: FAD-dependent oxidoreductase [Deltaproteobacteria bacterium]|nr:MAG: FAD-dependent oxidoreductase [Deltaproteobacteria bacterium]
MKTASKDYPSVINIVGAGNVGVWTAYRLTKLYEAHGLATPEIHLFDKNPQAAQQISAQIGAHLQPDETLHDFEHELHRLNLLFTYTDGGRMMGSSDTKLEERLEVFGDRGLEWLLQYVTADQGVEREQFEARLGRQIQIGTRSMQLWQEVMAELDGPIPDFKLRTNFIYGYESDGGGILKFMDAKLPPGYVTEGLEICNDNGLNSRTVQYDEITALSDSHYGLDEVKGDLAGGTCLLQDGGAFQSEIATRLALDYMVKSTGFNVTFHPETEISNIRFAADGCIEALETADGSAVAEGGTFVFGAGNIVKLFETSQMSDSIPMMGICGVTQNIDPGLEFWKGKKTPRRPIKSVTAGDLGGITKCVITPDFFYEQHEDGSIKRGDDGESIIKSMYIRVGGQFGFRDYGLEKLGFLSEIGDLDPDLEAFVKEALQRELEVMEELWPGIVDAARANYRKTHQIPDGQEVSDADMFQQWLQARPGSSDHCAMVGQLDRNVDGEQVAVPNAWSIMGRGSGGVSFVQADAEMLFQEMVLGKKPEEVVLVNASGEIIHAAGESANPRRFTDGKGLFAYQDKSGNQVAIAGSIQTPEDKAHAILLIAAAARTVTP